MKLPIAEIYPAIQAEGMHRTPAVFVRVHGCNLRCGWSVDDQQLPRCDTPYAVYKGEKVFMEASEVAKKVKSYNTKHVVFTGGEPLLFGKGLEGVIKSLGMDYFYEVETNGTLEPTLYLKNRVDQFNVSPKLFSSKQWRGYDQLRVNREALASFPPDKSMFKFVVSNPNEMAELKIIASYNPQVPIYLMPKGDTRKEVIKNIPGVMELCMKHGYGFSNRDHILAYDDKRGV